MASPTSSEKPFKTSFTAIPPMASVAAEKKEPNFFERLRDGASEQIVKHPTVFKFVMAAVTSAIAVVAGLPTSGIGAIAVGAAGAALEELIRKEAEKIVDKIEKEKTLHDKEKGGNEKEHSRERARQQSASVANEAVTHHITDADIRNIQIAALNAFKSGVGKVEKEDLSKKHDGQFANMVNESQTGLSQQDLERINAVSVTGIIKSAVHSASDVVMKLPLPVLHTATSKPKADVQEPVAQNVLDKSRELSSLGESGKSFSNGHGTSNSR